MWWDGHSQEGWTDDDTFRSLLLDQPTQVLTCVAAVDASQISERVHEQLCIVMEDAAYDPATAARESEGGLFLDLHQLLVTLRRDLDAGTHPSTHPASVERKIDWAELS